jgi:hypothetical protein
MKIIFNKISHKEYILQCIYKDEMVFNKTLEAKSCLKLYLMHYCVEKNAKLDNSFFGRLTNALSAKNELSKTKKVVTILQSIDNDTNYSSERYFVYIQNAFGTISEAMPSYINIAFVDLVYKEYLRYLNVYKYIRTGYDSQMILFF